MIPCRVVCHLKTAVIAILLVMPAIQAWGETGSNSSAVYRTNLSNNRYFITRANLVTRDGLKDPYFGFVDANIGLQLTERWAFSLGYRHTFLEQPAGIRQEHRPQFDIVYQRTRGGWRLHNRGRLELRLPEGETDNHFRLRNRAAWTAPFTLFNTALTPYIADEFFYEFNENNFNLNWLTLGVVHSISKKIKLTVGYRWQARKLNNDWSSSHFLVTGITIVN